MKGVKMAPQSGSYSPSTVARGVELREVKKQIFELQLKLAGAKDEESAAPLLSFARKFLKAEHIDGIVEERSMLDICGLPGCSKPTIFKQAAGRSRGCRGAGGGRGGYTCSSSGGTSATAKYWVQNKARSAGTQEVLSLDELGKFCSQECQRQVFLYKQKLSDEPEWSCVDKNPADVSQDVKNKVAADCRRDRLQRERQASKEKVSSSSSASFTPQRSTVQTSPSTLSSSTTTTTTTSASPKNEMMSASPSSPSASSTTGGTMTSLGAWQEQGWESELLCPVDLLQSLPASASSGNEEAANVDSENSCTTSGPPEKLLPTDVTRSITTTRHQQKMQTHPVVDLPEAAVSSNLARLQVVERAYLDGESSAAIKNGAGTPELNTIKGGLLEQTRREDAKHGMPIIDEEEEGEKEKSDDDDGEEKILIEDVTAEQKTTRRKSLSFAQEMQQTRTAADENTNLPKNYVSCIDQETEDCKVTSCTVLGCGQSGSSKAEAAAFIARTGLIRRTPEVSTTAASSSDGESDDGEGGISALDLLATNSDEEDDDGHGNGTSTSLSSGLPSLPPPPSQPFHLLSFPMRLHCLLNRWIGPETTALLQAQRRKNTRTLEQVEDVEEQGEDVEGGGTEPFNVDMKTTTGVEDPSSSTTTPSSSSSPPAAAKVRAGGLASTQEETKRMILRSQKDIAAGGAAVGVWERQQEIRMAMRGPGEENADDAETKESDPSAEDKTCKKTSTSTRTDQQMPVLDHERERVERRALVEDWSQLVHPRQNRVLSFLHQLAATLNLTSTAGSQSSSFSNIFSDLDTRSEARTYACLLFLEAAGYSLDEVLAPTSKKNHYTFSDAILEKHNVAAELRASLRKFVELS
ncbi:unnamed protein product [Amoebophrya sp. A25]|nr:unnamed protein product [Amoebophrya sp. A25]|eukprot:GSA25T00023881001.1